MIPVFERPKTLHALDRVALVIGDAFVILSFIPMHQKRSLLYEYSA
jgi:hypothetical protein